MGIEPTPSAWKAEVLPLNYARLRADATARAVRERAELAELGVWRDGSVGACRGGGGNRIRTCEGFSHQIYSLTPLAARESPRVIDVARAFPSAARSRLRAGLESNADPTMPGTSAAGS